MGRTLTRQNSPYYYYFFYLWSYLKDVYENNPQTIPELKRAVTTRIQLEEFSLEPLFIPVIISLLTQCCPKHPNVITGIFGHPVERY
jgi:hypothetical protein